MTTLQKTSFNSAARAVSYLLLAVLAILFVFPFFWLVTASFKTSGQMFIMTPRWISHPGTLGNFRGVFQQTNIFRAFWNSLVTAFGNVLLTLLVCSMAGYASPSTRKLRATGR